MSSIAAAFSDISDLRWRTHRIFNGSAVIFTVVVIIRIEDYGLIVRGNITF